MFTESRLRQVEHSSLWVAWAVLAMGGCGSPPEAASPNGDSSQQSNGDESASAPLIEGDPLGEQTTPSRESDPMARCEGGQCFQCGDSICPEGFFCDSDSTCAWLPQCTGSRLSCECLESHIKGCRCQNNGGHFAVSCSE